MYIIPSRYIYTNGTLTHICYHTKRAATAGHQRSLRYIYTYDTCIHIFTYETKLIHLNVHTHMMPCRKGC